MNTFNLTADDLNDFSIFDGGFRNYHIYDDSVEILVSRVLIPRSILHLGIIDVNEDTLFKVTFNKCSYIHITLNLKNSNDVKPEDMIIIEIGDISNKKLLGYAGGIGTMYIDINLCCDEVILEKVS